ncbi:DNA adenine methylase [Ewingella americana]|nr:DNA adenine methylase [Ewingella americana]
MRTIVKWAGSKSRVMDKLKEHLPAGDRLVEPFAGSCSVMMNTDYPAYLVADINPHLINLYNQIKENPEWFIADARHFFEKRNTPEDYYAFRAEFNAGVYPYFSSLIFLYLNRHCFNGLCRYNAKGEFNVPYGKYKKPYFPEDEIRAFAEKAKRATFICASFIETLQLVQAGDVIYCDPPYLPQTATSDFSNYHTAGFTYDEHQRLKRLLRRLADRSYPVVVSNSATPDAMSMYSHAGFDIEKFSARRSIGASAGCAQSAEEIIAKITPKNPQYLLPDPAVDSLLMAGFPMREDCEVTF